MMRFLTTMSCALVLSAAPAAAQPRVDVGLLLGSTATTDQGGVLQFDRGRTYQATFAWGVWHNEAVRVAVEVPFLATPAFDVTTPGRLLPKEYASLYLTPGVRVTVLADKAIALFGAVGAGYARYSESKLRVDDSPNPAQLDTNTDAIQFGGGLDVRVLRWLGLRAEVRDLWTGARKFSVAPTGERVHNVVASAGLVLRF